MVERVCHGCRSNTHAASATYTLATIGWGRGQGEGVFKDSGMRELRAMLDPISDLGKFIALTPRADTKAQT
jgi:hypothetical protein